jgi:aminoglycoside phosphotransferase (APT) family kinase protein
MIPMKSGIVRKNRAAHTLGSDLAELIEGLGSPPVEIVPITSFPSAAGHSAVFRIHFTTGVILKGRRLPSPERAERMHEMVGALADKGLAAILARKGSAVLEEWMPGTTLNDGVAGADVLERCGELLGSIHGVAVPRSLVDAYGPGPDVVRQRIDRLNSEIDDLTRTSLITPEFASQLTDTARCAAPADASVGFVHGDFSPENIVRDPGDSLYCIDNVKVALDAYDWDLARTRYLWPMDETQTAAFFEGYHRYRDSQSFWAHLKFWMICVLVRSALFRHGAGSSRVSEPIARLKGIHREFTPQTQ